MHSVHALAAEAILCDYGCMYAYFHKEDIWKKTYIYVYIVYIYIYYIYIYICILYMQWQPKP